MLLADATRGVATRLADELEREELRRRNGATLRRPILRNLVWGADTLAEIILSIWRRVCETLQGEGFEGRELAGYCQVLLDGIDACMTGYQRLLALTDESGLTAEAGGFRELAAKLPTLREARPKVVEALALATRTMPPVDERALAESGTALERGEFVTIDDEYLARLRAGEDA